MTACELCSGRHATSACVLGSQWVEQCMAGTPDDYRPLPDNVVELVTAHTHRRGDATRRAMHHWGHPNRGADAPRTARTRRDEGTRVVRLG